jgi:hypothetical protein
MVYSDPTSSVPGIAIAKDIPAFKKEQEALGIGYALSGEGSARNLGRIVPKMSAQAIQVSPALNTASNLATYGWQHFSEGGFRCVRLTVRNYGAAPLDLTTMKCAPAATHLHNGSGLGWIQVTFNGGSITATIPAATGTGVNTVPGLLVSDVIYVKSLARTDFPTYKPLLHTRTVLAAAATVQNESSASRMLSTWNNDPDTLGRQLGTWFQSGDFVTGTPPAKTMTDGGTSYWSAGVGVEFFYDVPTVSMLWAGDSLIKGAMSSGYILGMAQRASMLLSDSGTPASSAVYALSSQTTTASLATLKALIAAGMRPTFTFIKNWSPNDGTSTDAIMDACAARVLDGIAAAREAGIIPILLTSPADGTTTSATRLAVHNAWTRTLGEVVVDLATALDDPDNPGHLLPAYDGGDDKHWSNAGHAKAALSVVESVRLFIPVPA